MDIEKQISDIIWRYFGVGWNKNSEKPITVRACFDECAKEIVELIRGNDETVYSVRIIRNKS